MIKRIRDLIKTNKGIILPLVLLPYFVEILNYIFSGNINTIFDKYNKIPIKLTSIFSEYKDYYAAIFGILATVLIFNIEQQDKVGERNKENEKFKEKELENYRNYFRPTFLVNSNEIKLIMQNKNFFIKDINLHISKKGESDQNNHLEVMRDGQSFETNEKGEIFISGITMIGEKFIYGNFLSGFEIYKVLKEKRSAILPSIFIDNDSVKDNIQKNWLGYNDYNNNEVTDLDLIFMYKSVAFREIMDLNISKHIKKLLDANDVENLFNLTLGSISLNKTEFNDEVRKNIIKELLEILRENLSEIEINILDLDSREIDYINNKIKSDSIYENKNNNNNNNNNLALFYVVNEYINFEKFSIDNIISVFLELSKKSVYNNKFLSNMLIQYKTRIIDHIQE